jgi:site-specific recombinase XerD
MGAWKRVKLCKDKTAAQQLLNQMVKRSEMERAGIGDPFEEHRKRPLAQHLADFGKYLESKGNTVGYAKRTAGRVQAILNGCRFTYISDLSPSAVIQWLAEERKAGRLGIKTSNYYLRDMKAFCRWLVRDRRTNDNPLVHLSGMNAAVEASRERRTLTEEDFAALVTAAKQGGSIRMLSGPDRAVLYTLAAYVGSGPANWLLSLRNLSIFKRALLA